MRCRYHKDWGCKQPARHADMCMPHAMLFLWLIYGPGGPTDRLREHDGIAGLPASELEAILRGPVWDPRLRALRADMETDERARARGAN